MKWEAVKGYEGLYEVNERGQIRSVSRIETLSNGVSRRKKSKLLKPTINENGYLYVTLSRGKRSEKKRVHRIVAEAFIDNPNDYKDINHKDENKSNNDVSNLEWCTRSYNINYGTRNKRHSDKLRKPVKQITESGESILWDSLTEIERKTGFSKRNISACCNNRQGTAYGSRWFFI